MPLTSTHWGTFNVKSQHGRVTKLTPFVDDPDPSKIGESLPELLGELAALAGIPQCWKGPDHQQMVEV